MKFSALKAVHGLLLGFTFLIGISIFFDAGHNSVEGTKCDEGRNGIWRACGNETTSEGECTKLKCCYASDGFIMRKGLNHSCVKQPEGFVWKSGQCLIYNGSVCDNFMAKDNSTANWRFFDNRYGVKGTEAIIQNFLSIAKRIVHPGECQKLISVGLCYHALAGCSRWGTVEPVCREDCDVIFSKCNNELLRLYGAVELMIQNDKINFSHINVPDCKDLPYSYNIDPKKNQSCRFTGLFTHTRPKPQEEDNTKYIIIGVVIPILLIVLAIMIIICVKKRRSKKEKVNEDVELFVSMRHRLREDSTQNPLMDALAKMDPEDEPPNCRLDNVEYVKDLGQGQFGKVFQGKFRVAGSSDQVYVAVKVLKEGSSEETEKAFAQEVLLMSCLHHDNILKLVAVSTEERPFCMVFEYMANGDLNQFLRKNDPDKALEGSKEIIELKVDDLIDMSRQVACGMEYLSGKKFIHRDLATRNCLVGSNMEVKIADFGMSRDIYESDYYRVGGATMLPIRWMPPEALLYGTFTIESDVYSYGVLLWEIFTFALQPFYGYANDEVIGFIKKGVILPKPEMCPEDIYYKVMAQCFHKEANRRPSFTTIIKRLEGDIDYTEPANEVTLPQKKNDLSAGLDAAQKSATPRIRSKKSTGDNAWLRTITLKKDDELPEYQNINPRDSQSPSSETSSHFGYTSDEQGAMVNPAYCELEGELTLRREIRGQSVDSNYDVPRSLTDLAAAGPGEEPIMQKMSFANKPDTRDHSNSVYDVPRSQSDHEVGEIMRKRYVSTKDVKKLSTIKREGLTKSNDENVSKMSASTPELLNWAGESDSYEPAFRPLSGSFSSKPFEARTPEEQKVLERIRAGRSFKFKLLKKDSSAETAINGRVRSPTVGFCAGSWVGIHPYSLNC